MADAATRYNELLDWLYAARTRGMKLGLDNTRKLLEALGNPHHGINFLHIAGTNGKGSTCVMIDAILRAHGYSTGLFTSPHIVDFRERIRIDGVPVSRDVAAAGLTRLKKIAGNWHPEPTFFELSTVLAIDIYARANVDFAILETGMGGRLDSTNVVQPLVSVITPIGLDHCQWLGDTLEQIAAEKAGIIKPQTPVVSHPQEPPAAKVIHQVAKQHDSTLIVPKLPYPTPLPLLPGKHQQWNAAVACASLQAAAIKLEDSKVAQALAEARWPGRFQRVADWLVMDAAHNPQAATTLVNTWRECFGDQKCTLLFGALADKDIDSIFKVLRPIVERTVTIRVSGTRACSASDLAAKVSEYLPPEKIQAHDDIDAAVEAAKSGGLTVLAAGSLFLVGMLTQHLKIRPV